MAARSRKAMFVKRYVEKTKSEHWHGSDEHDLTSSSCLNTEPISRHLFDESDDTSSDFPVNQLLRQETIPKFNPVFQVTAITNTSPELLDDSDTSLHNTSDKSPEGRRSDLITELRGWAQVRDVSHAQLDSLLKILKQYHPELPSCSKTLLSTVRKLDIKNMLSANNTLGEFTYLGIENGLTNQLNEGLFTILNKRNITHLELLCNVDGLPIHKSTSCQMWPLLVVVYLKGCKIPPFAVAIFIGNAKPFSLETYIECFIDEINILTSVGFMYNQQRFTVALKYFICDAPARSFLKSIKPHNSYFGCEKCNIKGRYVNYRILYKYVPGVEARTDDTFSQQLHKEHHLGTSPLTKIANFGLVTGFILDYMHMACLGTMRRLLNYWFKSSSEYCVSPSLRKEASRRMLQIAVSFPKEFNRKPRTLSELDRWKASEFRSFLLYSGPVVLKGLLSEVRYKHFLYFHCAMRIVCDGTYALDTGRLAVDLIEKFSKNFENLYGNSEPVYNTHSLVHLVEEAVRNRYSLNDFNCFVFENYLGKLKRMLRTPNRPLSQVCKRLLEQNSLKLRDSIEVTTTKISNKIVALNVNHVTVSTSRDRESYILLKDNKVMKVLAIIEEHDSFFFVGSLFLNVRNMFDDPPCSACLDTFKVSHLSTYQFKVSMDRFLTKCLLLPLLESDNNSIKNGSTFMAIGMLHSD